MCGRFVFKGKPEILKKKYSTVNVLPFTPNYNIAPTQPVLAICAEKDATRYMDIFYWGLVPSWAKDISIGQKMINARAETIDEKPAFLNAFKRRRCIIPASGFYEWQKPSKQPYYFSSQAGTLSIAGIWEHWMDSHGNEVFSCAIVTTQANHCVEPVHARMPVILEDDAINIWLSDTENTDLLKALLTPYESTKLQAWTVDRKVSNPANNFPELTYSLETA